MKHYIGVAGRNLNEGIIGAAALADEHLLPYRSVAQTSEPILKVRKNEFQWWRVPLTAPWFPDTLLLATQAPEVQMNDQLNPHPDLDLPIQDQIIDQLTIIRGCVHLVLLRYPGDLFLRESLGKVMDATERLAKLARKEIAD